MVYSDEQIAILRKYSTGHAGTRDSIERAGFEDHADLLIALGHLGLALPPPADWPGLEAHLEAATTILQPLLRSARAFSGQ